MNPWQWIAARIRANITSRKSGASRRPDEAETRLRVMNRTRGTLLATQLEVAASGKSRRKGLLGRTELASGDGLWIVPCESVHTFFMQFPIDLVYLDRNNRIRKLRSEVGPWRMSACLSAHSVLELPRGTIRATRAERGDAVEFGPCETSC
jgi:uncharacterized membrane protein (UPF0127 family)